MAKKGNLVELDDARFPEEMEAADELEIELSSPISHGEEEITKLSIRKPTVEDICRTGMLLQSDTSGKISIDMNIGRKYLIRLSNQPNSVINKMTPHDFVFAVNSLVRFFA
jgi:hypothetical protein